MSKARVVHLTSVHSPFDTRILWKECVSLAKAGYDVSLIAPWQRDEIVSGVCITALPRPRSRWQRFAGTDRAIYHKALSCDADAYHFHDPELIPVGLALRARNRRVIYDVHEDVPRSLLSKQYLPAWARPLIGSTVESIESLAGRGFSAVVAATPTIGARFRPINQHTVVIPNFPLRDELHPRNSLPWHNRPPSVAYVGGIALGRGLRQMVDAMAELPQSLGVTLELAGDFSVPGQREQVCTSPGWVHVHEHGPLPRDEVAQLLGTVRAGLVLFLPEPNHVRALPNKLFEYMSAGIPVIASDFPLWRSIVGAAECGLLVDPADPKVIAGAIEYLIAHPHIAEAMGNRGRQVVEQRYNWSLAELDLLALYAELLMEI